MRYKVQTKSMLTIYLCIIAIIAIIVLIVSIAVNLSSNSASADLTTQQNSTEKIYTYANCNFEPRIATLPKWDSETNVTEYVRSIDSVNPSNEELPRSEKNHTACIATLPLYGGQAVWDVYLGYTFLDYKPVITIKNNNGFSLQVFDCKVKNIEVNAHSIVITSNTNKEIEITCSGIAWEEYMVVF